MAILIRKLTPDLAKIMYDFLTSRHTMTIWMNISAIVCVGVTPIRNQIV